MPHEDASGFPASHPHESARRPELDGLRGVAATMVLLSHCLEAVGAPSELQSRLMKGLPGAIGNGNSAVVLFFVLSGMVLTESLQRSGPGRAMFAYFVRRVLRLWPAYAVALLVAWTVTAWTSQAAIGDGASPWLRATAQVHLTASQLLASLPLPGPASGQLPQGWTLTIELVLSLLLPAMLAVARAAGVSLVAAAAALGLAFHAPALWQFSLPFVAGVALALHREAIGARVAALSPLVSSLLLASSAAAFLVPPYQFWARSRPLGMALTCGGAVGVVLLAPRVRRLVRLLRSQPLERLGRISYSVYLLHLPVLLAVAAALAGDAPATTAADVVGRWLALAALVACATLPLASLSWRWVERPGIAAGRRYAARLSASTPATNAAISAKPTTFSAGDGGNTST